jgi:TRAP-type transport system periplasmic protein
VKTKPPWLLSFAVPLLASLAFAPSARAEGEVVVKLATVAPEGSPWAITLEDFKKRAEAAVPGKLKVKLFLGGKLGDENETVQAVKRGQIQAVGATTGAMASQVPDFNVLELPYLFRNYEEVDHITENVVKEDIIKACSAKGLVFGFWSENGFRGFGGRFPVKTPADLKGRKMRSQESPIHLAMYRDLGASPVPIPSTEALTSIQTGVVDGYDQAPLYLFAASWYTASTHYTVSDHIYQGAAIIYNKDQWDKWPPEVQKALAAAGAAVQADLKKQVRAMNPILLDNLKNAGMTISTLTAAEKAPFEAIAEKTRQKYMASASASEKAMYQKITKALADKRKN